MKITNFFMSKLRLHKIRNKILFSMIAISIPSLILLGIISANISKNTILDINTSMNTNNLRTLSNMLDLRFQNINNLNITFVLDEAVRNDLRNSNISSEHNIRESILSNIRRVSNSNTKNILYVNSICLINLKYDIFCNNRSDDFGKYEYKDVEEVLPNEYWYKLGWDANGKVKYIGENIFGDQQSSFSSVKLFRDGDSSEGSPIGLLVMNISKTIFNDLEQNLFNGFNIIIDQNLSPLTIVNETKSIDSISIEGLEALTSSLRENGYLVSKFENDTTDWIILNSTEIAMLLQDSSKITNFTFYIVLIIALLASIIAYFISGSIIQPLLELKRMSIDWSSGKKIKPQLIREDEISVISSTLSKVATENEELNHRLYDSQLKAREAELRALQAQINPHFLYNTLDSIYWKAVLQDNEDIANMAVSLSESFKLSLNKGKETILISNELKHIRHYLNIQNIRYNNRFHFIEDVEESLLAREMLKLTIQPLVENAITHGLEPKVGRGTIKLVGRLIDQWIIFEIEDDGVGISNIEDIEKGYGINNVRERIRLYYGRSSEFIVNSEHGKGTKITLKFMPMNGG